jgi:hypothetical protein
MKKWGLTLAKIPLGISPELETRRRTKTSFIHLIAVAICVALGSVSVAQANDAADMHPRLMVVRAEGPGVGGALAKAIDDLYSQGNLLRRAIYLNGSKTPFQALVKSQRWPVEFDHIEIERILCKLNETVCHPVIVRVKGPYKLHSKMDKWSYCARYVTACHFRWTIQQSTKVSEAAGSSCGVTQFPSRTALCIPYFDASEYLTNKLVAISRDREIAPTADLYLRCRLRTAWNIETLRQCHERASEFTLDQLNVGSYKAVVAAYGRIYFPTIGVSITFEVPDGHDSKKVQDSLVQSIKLVGGLGGSAQAALEVFDAKIVRQGILGLQGAEAESPKRDDNEEVSSLELVRVMHGGNSQVDRILPRYIAKIAVIETGGFVRTNPELKEMKALTASALNVAATRTLEGSPQLRSATCPIDESDAGGAYEEKVEADSDATKQYGDGTDPSGGDDDESTAEHTPGVLSVLGAKKNKHFTAGVLPLMGLSEKDIWLIRAGTGINVWQKGVLRFFSTYCGPPAPLFVVNYSASDTTDQGRSAIAKLIADTPGALFVSAAKDIPNLSGGDKKNDQATSSVLEAPNLCELSHPACLAYKTPNIISVGAMTADGASPSELSVRGLAYEVAAVGEKVKTISGQETPRRTSGNGSSYSVPYVSALASLIYGDYLTQAKKSLAPAALYPSDVKVRILSTSDLTEDPDGTFEFGEINFDRALGVESDKIEFSAKGDACNAKKFEVAKGSLRAPTIFQANGGGKEVNGSRQLFQVELKDLLRIRRICGANAANMVFDVVVRERVARTQDREEWERAVRYTAVDLKAYELSLVSADGEKPIALSQIRNFTACMRPQLRAPASGCLVAR